MQGIFSGIQNLWNGILSIIDGIKIGIQFLIGLVKSLFELIKLLATTVTNTTTIIMTLPPWLIAVTTATLGICVLYMIIGRETGK